MNLIGRDVLIEKEKGRPIKAVITSVSDAMKGDNDKPKGRIERPKFDSRNARFVTPRVDEGKLPITIIATQGGKNELEFILNDKGEYVNQIGIIRITEE